jgi:hypothetical protein
LPEPLDEEDDDERDHFISIGVDQKFRKGHVIDIYVSLVTDFQHKIIINMNEKYV